MRITYRQEERRRKASKGQKWGQRSEDAVRGEALEGEERAVSSSKLQTPSGQLTNYQRGGPLG